MKRSGNKNRQASLLPGGLSAFTTNIIFVVIMAAGQNIDAESMRMTFSLWELAAVVTGAWKYGKRKSRELQDKNDRDS